MSSLVAIVYPSEKKAEDVRDLVFDLATRYLIKFNDLVIVTRDDKGRVKLNQLFNTTASGAAGGSFWGLLIGMIFLNPLLGVAAGAAGGAISGALSDVGINDAFMMELGAALKPGDAALFVLVQDMTADKVLAEIKVHGGVVLHTSLDETRESELREALASADSPSTP
ncbi:DUF1269 domain-containing protein [Synechococcus sp. 1G10]|uniref:DUF1269 domain-containing protein n=1 Tax=Synechococcus sp. 1G10 TaxID=2025605 RepID=UPI000B98BDC4|nr:DUF1269 domain-containing protein [Synechococcus sp. 1G10]